MYEGPSFSQNYEHYCNQRQRRRKQIHRLGFEFLLLVSVIIAILFLSDKLKPSEVWATPDKQAGEITFTDILGNQNEKEPAFRKSQKKDRTDLLDRTPVVFVDAGHGGNDGGCLKGDIVEKDLNLAIAKQVKDKLTDAGFRVIMSRENDTYVTKEDRVKKANAAGADIYVSIHQNFSEESGVKGMEVWYDGTDTSRDSRRLALLVSHQTAKSTQALEREVRGDADFHVTGSTMMPACLIETGFLSNKQERENLASQAYQEQVAAGIVQGITYYFYPKTLYLTFDDGPSEENTLRVLEVLRKRNIKATFFLVGENVEKHPDIARKIAAEGHTIGIHCYSHGYNDLYESAESYMADFERARQAVYRVTGVDARIFRFPGGSINHYNQKVNAEIIREMTKKGYTYYDWNASLEDAVKKPDPTKLLSNGVQTTLGRSKVILLAHDVVYDTGTILDELFDSLPEYEIKPISEGVEPIHFSEEI